MTIGGSIFTRLVDNIRRCPSLFELTDDIVVFEGETALLELVNQLAGKKDYSKVPNLIYRQNGKITVNQPFSRMSISFPRRTMTDSRCIAIYRRSRSCRSNFRGAVTTKIVRSAH